MTRISCFYPLPGARLRLKLFPPTVFIDLHREKTVDAQVLSIFRDFNVTSPWTREGKRLLRPMTQDGSECKQSSVLQTVNDHFQRSGLLWVHTQQISHRLLKITNYLMTWIQESNDNWWIRLSTWILRNTLCRTFQASCSSHQKSKDLFSIK